jgi:D-glycero-D-manno-heptose 1,7-bisphosphate phosphatase
MLHRAARDLSLDLGASIMVGDRCSDIAASNAAGLRQAFLLAGTETIACNGRSKLIQHLSEVTNWLQTQRDAT